MSSASIKDTSFKIRRALNVISSKFPIGVGTRYNFAIYIIYLLDTGAKIQHLARISLVFTRILIHVLLANAAISLGIVFINNGL